MNNDLISKSKLIKEIKDVGISQYLNDDGTMSDTYGSTTVMDYIENQPTVNQWIDVKDRLPTDDEDVLVYMGDGKERRVVLGWYWWEEWHTYDENYLDDDYEVVAWMPLPEYKKEV